MQPCLECTASSLVAGVPLLEHSLPLECYRGHSLDVVMLILGFTMFWSAGVGVHLFVGVLLIELVIFERLQLDSFALWSAAYGIILLLQWYLELS